MTERNPDTGQSPYNHPHAQHSDEEVEHSLLQNGNGHGPFHGPFDEPPRHDSTFGGEEEEEHTGYQLSDSGYAPPYNGYTEYKGTQLTDPGYGQPDRVSSPYSRSETASSDAWAQRQRPGGGTISKGALKRAATRKVKLVQGSVLSADYPVPSAIQNATQAKYRNDLESGSEEFTHVRCM